VDANNRVVPVIPGKQITTKQNRLLRGTIDSEDTDFVMLLSNAIKIKVLRRDILTITDVDLSESVKQVDATYSD